MRSYAWKISARKGKGQKSAHIQLGGGVLLGAEGASRAQAAQEGAAEGAAEAAAERPQRAPRKCSMCQSLEHTARTCPRRQATSQQIATPNIIVRG